MKALKSLFLILASLMCLASAHAKQAVVLDAPDNDTTIYTIVDEMPQFPGGDSAMIAYIIHNVHYPQAEKEQGIQGKVFVGFVVEKDGGISNVEVKRGIGAECDAEAIRAVKGMPNWEPGKQSGVLVRTAMVLPINFKIVAPPIDTTIYDTVEKMPSFPGGEIMMYDFLARNVLYPQRAREDGYSGTVYVRFVVEPDGTITNIEIAKGVGGGCSEEAMRVVKMMPNWIPGEAFGKKVRVSYTLPINFRLQ